jgi:hypothetical protein
MASTKPNNPAKPTPTKPNAPRTTKSGDVLAPVDPTLKRMFDARLAVIEGAKKRGSSAFDELWEAVGEIVEHDPPLYAVAGYKDAGEFFREALGETRRNAFRFIRVAKFASPREEARYGTTKLDAALSYLEAKLGAPLAHPPLPIAFDRLRVPTKDGKTLSLDDARVEDLTGAARALRPSAKKLPKTSLEKALVDGLSGKKSLGDVRVRVSAGLVTLSAVPAAALGELIEVLRALEWESPIEKKVTAKKRAKR